MQNKIVPWEQEISKSTEKIILELCGISPTKDNSMLKLVDTGCGNWRYLELFRKYLDIKNLYGTEMSDVRVNEVSKKGFNCILIKESGSKLPFNDKFFDLIFSSNVFEHIPKNIILII